jgi:hypothetical protein
MDSTLARQLVDVVERELSLHSDLLMRLRHPEQHPETDDARPTSARFWGRLLPESAADIWEEMKLLERERRDILKQISENSGVWRLSSIVSEMDPEEADELMALRGMFGVITAAIAEELRLRDAPASAA